ncbi:MAG: energy-coupled thiamine transporter ThiT [Culicoidibacterales bacterium]
MKAKKLAFMALALALAFALNLLEKSFLSFGWLNGGSIMVSLLPLFIVALRYGGRDGILVGIIYGVLGLLFGGFVVHPLQVLLDYGISFAMVGLVGFMADLTSARWQVTVGITLACLGMLASFVVSGAVFFAEYAPVGQSAWAYSLIYNATYLVPTWVVAIVFVPLLTKVSLRTGLASE